MQHFQSNKENPNQTQPLPQELTIYVYIFSVFFRNALNGSCRRKLNYVTATVISGEPRQLRNKFILSQT